MAITRGLPDAQALGGLKDGLAGNQVNAFLGSTALVNNVVQAGSVTLSADSGAWAVFGKPFTNIPVVVATYSDNNTANATAGSMAGTGSVYLQGDTASKVVDYIAFGTY